MSLNFDYLLINFIVRDVQSVIARSVATWQSPVQLQSCYSTMGANIAPLRFTIHYSLLRCSPQHQIRFDDFIRKLSLCFSFNFGY